MGDEIYNLAGAEDEWCNACLVHMHTPKNKMKRYATEWRKYLQVTDLIKEFICPEDINHL